MASRRPVLATLLAAASLAAGCTGDADPAPTAGPTRSAAPAIPTLATAWKAAAGRVWSPDPNSTSVPVWTTPTAVVVPGDRSFAAFATSDGRRSWTVDLPGSLCSISDTPNENGIAAFLVTRGTGSPTCLLASAIDTATGKVLWTEQLSSVLSDVGADTVQAGPDVVTVGDTCTAAVSLSVKDGSTVRTFPSGRTTAGSCGDSFAGDGRIVVDGRERNGRDGANALTAYDAVSGRRLWSVPVATDAAFPSPNIRMSRVVSSAPVVIDAEVNGHRFLRSVDPATGRATVFGRETDRTKTPTVLDLPGDVIAVQYYAGLLFAFDAGTGELRRRTVLRPGERVLGLRGDEVITASPVDPDTAVGDQIVRAVAPVTGTSTVLGRFDPAGRVLTVAGGTIVTAPAVASDTGVTAYRLPVRARAGVRLPAATAAAPGDLTPTDIVELVLGVTANTKRALGFVEPDLPVRADGNFFENLADDGFLQVRPSATAFEPTAGVTADEGARRQAAQLMRAEPDNTLPALTPVPGLGDEAGIVSRASRGRPFVRIVVRRANVVVSVDISLDGPSAGAGDTARLTRGARLVAADLVAEIDRRA